MCRSPLLRTVPMVALLAVLAGCAAGTTSSASGTSAYRLTEEQLAEYPDYTVYEVLQRLRMRWLRRDTDPTVMMDGVRAGGTEVLQRLYVREVQEIRYVPERDAGVRYGTGIGAVIEVQTKR